jgi:hypothetical protein
VLIKRESSDASNVIHHIFVNMGKPDTIVLNVEGLECVHTTNLRIHVQTVVQRLNVNMASFHNTVVNAMDQASVNTTNGKKTVLHAALKDFVSMAGENVSV